jgi:hypothetical protein
LDSVAFLRHLSGYFGSKLLVIWDGTSIHRSDEVRAFLADGWAEYIIWSAFQPMPQSSILMKVSGSVSNTSSYVIFAALISFTSASNLI